MGLLDESDAFGLHGLSATLVGNILKGSIFSTFYSINSNSRCLVGRRDSMPPGSTIASCHVPGGTSLQPLQDRPVAMKHRNQTEIFVAMVHSNVLLSFYLLEGRN